MRPLLVANPHAPALTFLDSTTRTRRDHAKYLKLIRSIALLHQYQRPVRTVEHQGRALRYIEVSAQDIVLANRLADEVLGRTLDELPPQTRRLLGLLEEMVSEACEELQLGRRDYRFTRRQMRERTGWGNTQPILERYQRWLLVKPTASGRPMSHRSQYGRLVTVRGFFRWCAHRRHILYNPASELTLPRLEQRLPRHILTVEEVERVLAVPDVEDVLGFRDRAMLEVLYSTGMRRGELLGLTLSDLDRERGVVAIREGKGSRDRIVPIGERALAWVEKYLAESRPELEVDPDEPALFLSVTGQRLEGDSLTHLAHEYVKGSGVGKSGSCHLFRHTAATLMLEHGADVRFIQALLGHANLSTTAVYTRVSIAKLKAVHQATHPARLKGSGRGGNGAGRPSRDDAEVLLQELALEDEESS